MPRARGTANGRPESTEVAYVVTIALTAASATDTKLSFNTNRGLRPRGPPQVSQELHHARPFRARTFSGGRAGPPPGPLPTRPRAC